MIAAERTLTLRTATQNIPVPIKTFVPVMDKDTWGCRWEIHWPDRLRNGTAFGFDGMQALVHALQTIGTEIYESSEHKSGQLSWTESRSGYGFPVPQIIRDSLIGDDANYF